MQSLFIFLYYVLEAYYYILIAYILLSWIPSIRQSAFYATIAKVADPYMRIFRGWFVFGQMDFTPIVGFLLFQFGLQGLAFFITNFF